MTYTQTLPPSYLEYSNSLLEKPPQSFTKIPPELYPKPTPTELLSLPDDILILIGDHLDSKDLYSLSHTHRHLLVLFTPIIVGGDLPERQSGVPFEKLPKAQHYPELPLEKLPELHTAALRGQIQLVQELLNDPRWPDVDERASDFQGKTPLYFATVGGHENVVRLLLDRGATINTAGEISYGKSALHMAASGCHEGIIRLLIKRGADVSCEDYKARTPIVWAARSAPPGKELVGVFQLLLGSGASMSNCDLEYGATVLHWAVVKGRKETVKLLLDRGANAIALNLSIKTPVNWALESGDEEMIKILNGKMHCEVEARAKGRIINWIKKFRSL